MTSTILVTTHCFTPLRNLKLLRRHLMTQCKRAGLKGDIQLSTKGIQLFVVGDRTKIDGLFDFLRTISGLETLYLKCVPMDGPSFSRLRVHIKKELILAETDTTMAPAHLSKICTETIRTHTSNGNPLLRTEPLRQAEVLGADGGKPQAASALTEKRRHELQMITTPLPGSLPEDNWRPIRVPRAYDRSLVLDFLGAYLSHIPHTEWKTLLAKERIFDAAKQVVRANHRVRAGERYFCVYPNETEPDVNADIRIVYEDEALVVVDKPAPLPVHPCGRFKRNTLQSILHTLYRPQKPHPAHRLDANTSGLIAFARTSQMARKLQPQFERGEVEKFYLVKCLGHPVEDQFVCKAPISTQPGVLGNRLVHETKGVIAHTKFSVLQRGRDGNALLQAVPLTGRTHQIRIHLWHLGFPICGDPLYLPGGKHGTTATLAPDDPPLCLHAWQLRIHHPSRNCQMHFRSEKPSWLGHLDGVQTL